MLAIVVILASAILGICLYGLVSPVGYVDVARWLIARIGVWGAAALRLVLALSLWLTAAQSATPLAFRVLAVISLGGALAVPLIGRAGIDRLIGWGSAQAPWVLRSSCALGAGLGGFLLWSALRGA